MTRDNEPTCWHRIEATIARIRQQIRERDADPAHRARVAADHNHRHLSGHSAERTAERPNRICQRSSERHRQRQRCIERSGDRDPAQKDTAAKSDGCQQRGLLRRVGGGGGIEFHTKPITLEERFCFVNARGRAAIDGLLNQPMEGVR